MDTRRLSGQTRVWGSGLRHCPRARFWQLESREQQTLLWLIQTKRRGLAGQTVGQRVLLAERGFHSALEGNKPAFSGWGGLGTSPPLGTSWGSPGPVSANTRSACYPRTPVPGQALLIRPASCPLIQIKPFILCSTTSKGVAAKGGSWSWDAIYMTFRTSVPALPQPGGQQGPAPRCPACPSESTEEEGLATPAWAATPPAWPGHHLSALGPACGLPASPPQAPLHSLHF